MERLYARFNVGDIARSGCIPENAPVIASLEQTAHGKVYQALVGYPWTQGTAIDIANKSSPHPEKMEWFGTRGDWVLARDGRSVFDATRLRNLHVHGLRDTWAYMESYLPKLYEPLEKTRPTFEETIEIIPLSSVQIGRESIDPQNNGNYSFAEMKRRVREAILRVCTVHPTFAQLIHRQVRQKPASTREQRIEQLIRSGRPSLLRQLKNADEALFAQCTFDGLAYASHKPYGDLFISREWQSRIREGEFSKQKGMWRALYIRDEDADLEVIRFSKRREMLEQGTMAFLEWESVEDIRTWHLHPRCPEDVKKMAMSDMKIDIGNHDFANPLAGLMLAGAESPHVVATWQRVMKLPGSTVEQNMTTAQAPGLAHLYRQQLLNTPFMERMERTITAKAEG